MTSAGARGGGPRNLPDDEVQRVPSLLRRLRPGCGSSATKVAGRTAPDLADVVVDGVPPAANRPRRMRCSWAVVGLTCRVCGGWLRGEGEGPGSLASRGCREDVYAIG